MQDTKTTHVRDEYEIKDDYRAVKRVIKIFKDPQRLKDVQDHIKANKDTEVVLDNIANGNITQALGM